MNLADLAVAQLVAYAARIDHIHKLQRILPKAVRRTPLGLVGSQSSSHANSQYQGPS